MTSSAAVQGAPAAPVPAPAPRLDTILVPTGLEMGTQAVLTHARILALALGARLSLFHAVPGPSRDENDPFLPPGELDALRAETKARERLRVLTTELGLPGEPTVHRAVRGIRECVLARLADLAPGLVVLGAHGHEGFHVLHPGSIGDAILRAATVPVLCVHGAHGVSRVPYRHVLAVPGGEPARRILQWTALIARAFGADVLVLHVDDEPERGDGAPVEPPSLRALAAEELAGLRYAVQCERGSLPGTVLIAAHLHDAGLVVVPGGTPTGIVASLLGTVAEQTARRAPCPVLVVP